MTEDLLSERLKKLPNDIRLIVEKRLALLALDLGERMSVVSGKVATGVVLGVLLAFAFLFLLVAIALFLGDVLRNPAGGFILVSVFLFVIAFFSWRLLPGMIERSTKHVVLTALLKEPPSTDETPTDE
jgi:Zn-dependent protease with chaperone function